MIRPVEPSASPRPALPSPATPSAGQVDATPAVTMQRASAPTPSAVEAPRSVTTGARADRDFAVLGVLRRELDPNVERDARRELGTNVVVTIFGKQCTGKGTVSSALLERLHGPATTPEEQKEREAHILSGGNTMRRIARQQGFARIEDFVEHLKNNPEQARRIDLTLDLSLLLAVVRGHTPNADTDEPVRVDIYEGRLAGLIGHDARKLGRTNVVVVQLDASPREQFLRYVNRELGKAHPGIRAAVEPHLAALPVTADYAAVRTAVLAIGDAALKTTLDPVVQNFENIMRRDERDRARYQSTYGRDILDPKLYELVIMTDGKTPEQVVDEILARVPRATRESA